MIHRDVYLKLQQFLIKITCSLSYILPGGGGGLEKGGSKRDLFTESIKTIGVNYRWLLLFNENVIFANTCTYNVGRLLAFHII